MSYGNSQRIQDCNYRIAQCEQQVRNYENDIQDLNRRLNRLMDGRYSQKRERDEFYRQMDEERSRLTGVRKAGNSRLAEGYLDTMGRFMNGAKCRDAMNAHDQIIVEIDRAIGRVEDEIRECNSRIHGLEGEIDSLQREIRAAY